jgi:hypothetical protein
VSNKLALRKPRKLGPGTILNVKLTKEICEHLAKGNTILTSCGLVGISERAFYKWMEKAELEDEGGLHFRFAQAVSQARAKAKKRLVKLIVDAAPQDWRAAGWLLSHCWPQEFSEIVRNEVGLLGGVILMPQKEDKAP